MNMTIKTKLYAGLGFLTVLVVLLWGSSLIFINILAENSSAIIKNNARSITYIEKMEQMMSELYTLQSSILSNEITGSSQITQKIDSLQKQLLRLVDKEQQNVTEESEGQLAQKLSEALIQYFTQFEKLRKQPGNKNVYSLLTKQFSTIHHLMGQITFLNLNAIHHKNEIAQNTASSVILYMTIIGAISTLLAIALVLKYPTYIANPIRELIARMKNIANRNYEQHLDIETGDEFEEMAIMFNMMTKRLQEYDTSNMAKLKNDKQRIEAVINHMNEAVIGLDEGKRLLFINSKAEELIGLKNDDIVGKHIAEVATTNKLIQKLNQNTTEHSKPLNREDDEAVIIKIDSANTKTSYYSREVIPVMHKDENVERKIGSIITLKNVTRFQEMDDAKTDFIAVVSHELKTPIASIGMSVRLLKDRRVGPLNDEQQELVKTIHDDTERMRNKTKDLLDFSKIETGNIQLNMQNAEPAKIIEYAYETMHLQAQQKNIRIGIECEKNVQPIKADIQKTVWVLINLIANALRYTPPNGSIKLKADDMGHEVTFSVTDTGKGISLEYLDKVFQKYFQVHEDKNSEENSGLGLAIAKEFIKAQGGEIAVESELGEGSTFYFTLPKA